jgi:hypothetical protein
MENAPDTILEYAQRVERDFQNERDENNRLRVEVKLLKAQLLGLRHELNHFKNTSQSESIGFGTRRSYEYTRDLVDMASVSPQLTTLTPRKIEKFITPRSRSAVSSHRSEPSVSSHRSEPSVSSHRSEPSVSSKSPFRVLEEQKTSKSLDEGYGSAGASHTPVKSGSARKSSTKSASKNPNINSQFGNFIPSPGSVSRTSSMNSSGGRPGSSKTNSPFASNYSV